MKITVPVKAMEIGLTQKRRVPREELKSYGKIFYPDSVSPVFHASLVRCARGATNRREMLLILECEI